MSNIKQPRHKYQKSPLRLYETHLSGEELCYLPLVEKYCEGFIPRFLKHNGRRLFLLLGTIISLFLSNAIAEPFLSPTKNQAPFSKTQSTLPQGTTLTTFAVFGDIPYNNSEIPIMQNMIAQMGKDQELSFILHIGDIKMGNAPCDKQVFSERLADFSASPHPFIYVFGDNEWTDCAGWGPGLYDPSERLEKLRNIFCTEQRSLGQTYIPLSRQSAVDSHNRMYCENIRWMYQGTAFIGINLPGGNNHWKSRKWWRKTQTRDNHEFYHRAKANQAWLQSSFTWANSERAQAVVLFFQANPNFEESPPWLKPPGWRDGYQEIREQLQAWIQTQTIPILIIHGDSHFYHVDKPIKDAQGNAIPNVTRLEVFGSPYLGWVKIILDPSHPNFFRIIPRRWAVLLH